MKFQALVNIYNTKRVFSGQRRQQQIIECWNADKKFRPALLDYPTWSGVSIEA